MDEEEGWFLDPFGLHEHRWFSVGHATHLVRDQGRESYDPAPKSEPPRPLTPAPERAVPAGADLKRADRETASTGLGALPVSGDRREELEALDIQTDTSGPDIGQIV